MVDRRYLTYFDWGLLALTFLLATIGLITLYSAVMASVPTPQEALFTKQLIWYGIGLSAMLICLLFNYKLMERYAWLIYSGAVLLLLWVMFFGKFIGGSRRWIVLGPVSLQPSELAKIAVIIILARYYAKYVSGRGFTLRNLQGPVIMTLVPFLLIVRQPDLGTAGLIGLIAASMTLFVKIESAPCRSSSVAALPWRCPCGSSFLKSTSGSASLPLSIPTGTHWGPDTTSFNPRLPLAPVS